MDISICTNEDCPFREECGRYKDNVPKEKLSVHQSYHKFDPRIDEENGKDGDGNLVCDFFEIRRYDR